MTTQILGYMADPTAESRKRLKQKARKEKILFFLKQRTLGLTMFTVGIVAPYIANEGFTASFLCIPFGLALIISKEKMINE